MIWFTSDLHFGHQNIINFCRRPFHSVDNMNKLLVMNWNEVVSPSDTVFVVGDFAMGKIAETLSIAGELNGTKILVAGNHDRCWKGEKKEEKRKFWIEKYIEAGFSAVVYQIDIWFDDYEQTVSINHFPFSGDSTNEDRFVQHRPIDDGQILIHGHVHDTWKVRGREVNVGVDVWNYYPVSIDEVFNALEEL